MTNRRIVSAVFAMALLAPAGHVQAGAFFISANGSFGGPCWCDGASPVQPLIPVIFMPGPPEECHIVSAAFRIEGVPDDPSLNRRFEPVTGASVTGDAFGDGAIVGGLVYEGVVGYIRLSIASPLPPQVWSVQAHRGLGGVTSAAAAFENAPDVWVSQPSHTTRLGSANPQCDACPELPPYPGCPFAVEPGTWSLVKRIYR